MAFAELSSVMCHLISCTKEGGAFRVAIGLALAAGVDRGERCGCRGIRFFSDGKGFGLANDQERDVLRCRGGRLQSLGAGIKNEVARAGKFGVMGITVCISENLYDSAHEVTFRTGAHSGVAT